MAKDEKKPRFFFILNQEEQVVGLVLSKTSNGALSKFEACSKRSKEGYRAERVDFNAEFSCALTSELR